MLSRLSRCHANVVPVIGLGAVCVFDDNGRIREEKQGLFAFCAVRDRRGMILPYERAEWLKALFSVKSKVQLSKGYLQPCLIA